MTKRYNKYKVLDLWNHELTISKLFRICMQHRNTHIIVDASKEATMAEHELWQDIDKFHRVLDEAIAHNEQNGNRVDIITGNYKLIPEERCQMDITLEEVEEVRIYKEYAKEQELEGEAVSPPVYAYGPTMTLLQAHFFDNIYTWPTYFLVWNGAKVAAAALQRSESHSDY